MDRFDEKNPGALAGTRRSVPRLVAPILAAQLLCLTGCPDPIGQFDEFSEQLANKPLDPAGDCGPETAQQVEGTFLLALATQLDPPRPVIALAEVSTTTDGMAMTWQPLAVSDRETPVGEPIVLPPAPIAADGTFTVQASDVFVDPAADPLMDAPIEATTITLSGTVCADFICGGMAADITEPLPITLEANQSKFAMERVVPGEAYPEPPQINCLGALAMPVDEI
ncbi:MAG: hypothetical protein JRI68_15830 [Deltaproteobacteria bacterium]|nr:hypothetical protein [Deltaproteobacteria bacterium]